MAKNKGTLKFQTEAKRFMTVEVTGKGTFEVPLPSSLPFEKNRELYELQKTNDEMAALDWFYDFFSEYLGEAIKDVTMQDFTGMVNMWQSETNPSMGESSA